MAETRASLTSPDRLHKIDQLREKNVGTHIPLPQLVVVGDQSSGKSSLLESITGIPFPNGQGLCTRYATQITHRRDTVQDVVVTIIPGPDATDKEKQRLASYHRTVQSTAELQSQYESILNEVNAHMGIKTDENPSGHKTFSRDVLKIEKRGPSEDYLTVIDVPGIFRNTEEGVTTETDKVIVLDMVKSYIEQDRTIILAVLPSTVDIMTQEILNLAEKYDKSGERTLGVLTKPDLLVEHSTKAVVCDLINGKKRPLNLGYYVVRNRGADEDPYDGASIKSREKMFQEEPWCHLPPDRVGVVALRERLQDLLGQITDKAFPKLRADARKLLADCQKSLDSLGVSRQTERDQQVFLCNIAGRFQSIVRCALDASYSSHPELESNELRLITDIVNLTEQFNNEFIEDSNFYAFEGDEPRQKQDREPFLDSANLELLKKSLVLFPELDGIVDMDCPELAVGGDIMEWINQMYRRSRGLDMGTFGPGLLSSAFREQSQNWEPMVRSYLGQIVLIIHRFIITVLEKVCADSKVFEELRSAIDEELLSRYRAAIEQAMFLVSLDRDTKPYTLSASFVSTLRDLQGHRNVQLFGGDAILDSEGHVMATDVLKAMQDKPKEQEVGEKIHDILEAYYDVARGRIVDSIFRQSVDHCLLTGPMSPLSLFTESWVLKLDQKSLASIAGEPRLIMHRREQLMKKKADLESALKILR